MVRKAIRLSQQASIAWGRMDEVKGTETKSKQCAHRANGNGLGKTRSWHEPQAPGALDLPKNPSFLPKAGPAAEAARANFYNYPRMSFPAVSGICRGQRKDFVAEGACRTTATLDNGNCVLCHY